MMPLTLAEVGEENIIRKIGGKQEIKTHLERIPVLRLVKRWRRRLWFEQNF